MEIKKTKTESTQNSNQVQASDQFLATNKAIGLKTPQKIGAKCTLKDFSDQ